MRGKTAETEFAANNLGLYSGFHLLFMGPGTSSSLVISIASYVYENKRSKTI